jgi:hypothetical protein
MAKEVFCRQCVLIRKSEDRDHQLVTWVPEKFAVEGKLVTVDDKPEVWTVSHVGDWRLSEKTLKERERVNRKYRQATDV